MQNPTLIFIPDISGFTEFVNTTAIEHSQHIISELLEIIIDANNLGFTISEIEGDAVLFYKNNEIPNSDEMIKLSREMFLRFHTHLHEIERNNVCQCGACKSASILSLKFITHLGETKEVNVNKFNKLIGSDLILAHRLLKNNIPSNEYLLLSDTYFSEYSPKETSHDDWIKINSNSEEIEKFGTVSTKYIDYSPLLKQLPKFIEENELNTYDRQPDVLMTIDAPVLFVHDKLTDQDAKYEYVKGIKKIETDAKINRVNTSHTCVFDDLEIHFVTKNNSVKNKNIAYSEEASLTSGFKFITDFRLKEVDGKTEVSIYIFKSKKVGDKPESLYRKIKDYFFLRFLIFGNRKGNLAFKEYCERVYKEKVKK